MEIFFEPGGGFLGGMAQNRRANQPSSPPMFKRNPWLGTDIKLAGVNPSSLSCVLAYRGAVLLATHSLYFSSST